MLEVLQWLAGRSDARTLRWACLDASGALRKAYAAVARAALAAPSLAARFVRVLAFYAGTLHAVTTRLAAGVEPRAPPRAPKRAVVFAVPVKAARRRRVAQLAARLPRREVVTMRSRRTGSRNIKTLPPTLPPATSTCVRTVNLSPSRFRHRRDVVDFRADGNGAGCHHDDGPVRQPQLLLPARK